MSGPLAVSDALNRRLVARRLRWAVVALSVLAAAIIAILGVDDSGTSAATRIDRAIDGRLVVRFAGHERLARLLADLGGPVPVLVFTAVLVFGLARLGRPRAAVLAACAPAIAIALTELVLKPLVDRTGAGQSFPSGHASGFGAVAFVLVVLVLDRRPRRLPTTLQLVASAGALAFVGFVSVALVAAQYHFASDALGGTCVGLVSVLALSLVIDWAADRRMRR